ncbi:FAD-dependent oxidoreductase [Litoribrevibacter albus]|uniref:Pyridine nucleotide-disulfide oxidoreductase n=1 Tax=Litoribrevibacter albus TaxID=1473156 RepID=A0AA37SEF0_9GAMM|nr:FAD-dependent oxidoreductase [Litoribrevibacter albus]GLQ33078.1 pyridine nucleotide-disulfide oxidoreductase [Litoribrevibacter albus]
MNKRLSLVGLLVLAVLGFWHFDLGHYLTLDYFSEQRNQWAQAIEANPWQSTVIFFSIYVAVTGLSLPGAAVMTLVAGALFGVVWGTILVSFASTLGATLAFLVARFILRDTVQNKFGDQLKSINQGIEKDGPFYLFTLRLIPVFPFFLINLVMGLTPIRTLTYFLVSQIGMLPGTIVYVNAGAELSQVTEFSSSAIFTPGLIGSFVLLGIFPWLAKALVNVIKRRQVYKGWEKPKTFDFNLLVIGAGAAGLVTSYIGAAVKAKVGLIERHKMGGDCLNTGCVPSKALLRSAKINHYIGQASKYGLQNGSAEVDFPAVMERVQEIIRTVEPHDSVERYRSLGVDCLQGQARLKSPYSVELNGEILTAKNIVIASGARPFVPPIPGLDAVNWYSSDTIWELREKPERLLILGGGPIGCELAQAFSRLGCQVSQVDMSERLMPREDEDVSAVIHQRWQEEGIALYLGHTAVRFESVAGQHQLIASKDGKDVVIPFDAVLLAVGRKANTASLGLDELGIELSERGTVEVNEYLQTKYPNILACGDVAGPYQFTHTASHQAWYASVNALFGRFKKFKVDYRVIPWATFTDPEVARVGLSEQEATEQGIAYEVTKYGIDDLDRAIADSEAHGFVKVLTEPGKDKILGVTIVGYHAGELIAEYVTAMKYGLGLNKILGTIHIYPTLTEANKYAAGEWKRAHVSDKALQWLEKFHRWMRS